MKEQLAELIDAYAKKIKYDCSFAAPELHESIVRRRLEQIATEAYNVGFERGEREALAGF